MASFWTETTAGWPSLAVAAGLALVAAFVLAELAARLARYALVQILGTEDPVGQQSAIVRRPILVIRLTVFLLAAVSLIFPALHFAGAPLAVGLAPGVVGAWFFGSGLRIVLIVVITYALLRILAVMTRRLERELSKGEGLDQLERSKRARTLGSLIHHAAVVVLVGVAALVVLRELRVDIVPMLTGAGIAGLAIGFGAQTLVRDVISGFFIILENQVRIGDVAQINGTGGVVEAINLRTIVLRDLEGVVHVFPNGAIERLANRTKDFSFYVVNVGVAYKEDPDHVMEVLREIGDGMMEDARWRPNLMAPLEILGVNDFGESQVTILIRIKTQPLKQWETGRELRRRIKKTFDARGIEIPFPHVSVYLGSESRPLFEHRER
jgi:moderate conductance mechanosensitive channel